MSGFNANVLLQGVANASPWLSSDELLAPRKQAVSEQRNALLNAMDQQTLAATDQEMVARASAYLNTLDEDKRAAAYPGIVAQLQQSGFAKNAPAQYPGHERIAQLASMGTPSKELLEQATVRRAVDARLNPPTGAVPGAAPGAAAPATAAPAAPGEIEPDAQARAFAVRDGLIRRGMDPETATAFAANALHESSANPNTGPGDRGASHGLFQWRDDRAALYQQLYGHAPDNAPLDEQLDFVMHELSGPESLAKGRIAAAQGAADKAAEVSAAYLRPKDVQGEMQRRRATAQQLAGSLPNVTPGMSDQAWLDQMTRQYPSLGGPNANPNQPGTPVPAGGVAARTGGTDVAGPGAGTGGVVAGTGGSATPAAPAAPAATTAAAPGLTPPAPVNPQTGLTAAQTQTRNNMLSMARTRDQLAAIDKQEEVWREHNDTARRQYEVDLNTWQNQQATRAREAKKDAAAEADAAKLEQSKSEDADSLRVLQAIGPKIRNGEPLTPQEQDQYDLHRRKYAEGPVQQVSDGKGGTIMARVGRDISDRFPPLPGQKEYAGVKPIPGTEKQPDFAPANAMTAMLDIGEGNRKIVKALDQLESYPAGVGLMRGSQPNIMSNWTDPEGVKVRAAIGDVQGHLYHTLAGTAQSAGESGRLRSFVPGQIDDAEAAKVKLKSMLDSNRQTLLDHYRSFGPEAGGRRLPNIEEEILATIPEAAVERLKKEPDTAKEFDRKFGRGAAKLALQNG